MNKVYNKVPKKGRNSKHKKAQNCQNSLRSLKYNNDEKRSQSAKSLQFFSGDWTFLLPNEHCYAEYSALLSIYMYVLFVSQTIAFNTYSLYQTTTVWPF